ncbi:MAG: DapH/DapD/GlmU-related protein [Parachlamydiaceae bacterium]|nr:DapH/DapD/GlmU-related protein [Parachlamydiaceae bacterium]
MNLIPSYFFDLSTFEHSFLFDENAPPWLALDLLVNYLNSLKLGIHKGKISSQAYLVNPELISIGENSVVEPGAYIQGPCVIGKNSIIRHGAYIRGNVLIGDHCVIGHDTEIKHSILLNHAHAAHFAYLGNSILGAVNLGAGVKCANLKLDRTEISLNLNGNEIKTGMKKFGAIIGDRTQIGCNSVTNPGTLIGQDVQCFACISLPRIVPSRSIIKPGCLPIMTTY